MEFALNERKKLLTFCVNFPQDMPIELKGIVSALIGSSTTTVTGINKWIDISEQRNILDFNAFKFLEKPNTHDIYNTLNYIIDTYHRGKNQSIAFGNPHHGFDIVFIEVCTDDTDIFIIDSYFIQNMFFTSISSDNEYVNASVRGYYASNPKVAELAKSLVEQAISNSKKEMNNNNNNKQQSVPVEASEN